MSRLFVAVELPAAASTELARIQPPPADGVRLVEPYQMHVTLHFIGDADVERVAAALASVQAAVLPLTVEGVGQFPSEDGGVILWAGVQRSPALLGLHTAVVTALAGEGFRPEARAYIPHVTLARCEPGVAGGMVNEFLARHAGSRFRTCRPRGSDCAPSLAARRSTVSRTHSSRGAGAGGTA